MKLYMQIKELFLKINKTVKAKVSCVNLYGATLRNVDLGCANLFSANLHKACLDRAILSRCKIDGAKMSPANCKLFEKTNK